LPEFTNNLFLGALAGKQLWRIVFSPPEYQEVGWREVLLKNTFGRIRDVAAGPDGAIYFTTSNRDGSGQPSSDDDQVLRIVPE
jgi:glucose/arabinose dehydrogenase